MVAPLVDPHFETHFQIAELGYKPTADGQLLVPLRGEHTHVHTHSCPISSHRQQHGGAYGGSTSLFHGEVPDSFWAADLSSPLSNRQLKLLVREALNPVQTGLLKVRNKERDELRDQRDKARKERDEL